MCLRILIRTDRFPNIKVQKDFGRKRWKKQGPRAVELREECGNSEIIFRMIQLSNKAVIEFIKKHQSYFRQNRMCRKRKMTDGVERLCAAGEGIVRKRSSAYAKTHMEASIETPQTVGMIRTYAKKHMEASVEAFRPVCAVVERLSLLNVENRSYTRLRYRDRFGKSGSSATKEVRLP